METREVKAQFYKDVKTGVSYLLMGRNMHSDPICGLKDPRDGTTRFVTQSELEDPKKFQKIK